MRKLKNPCFIGIIEILPPSDPENFQALCVVLECVLSNLQTALRSQVFERFSRLDESRSRDTGGFGLGMSIIKSVVDKHKGQIFLEDSAFNGLRIRLIFPN